VSSLIARPPQLEWPPRPLRISQSQTYPLPVASYQSLFAYLLSSRCYSCPRWAPWLLGEPPAVNVPKSTQRHFTWSSRAPVT
jgi:hypothetical protein